MTAPQLPEVGSVWRRVGTTGRASIREVFRVNNQTGWIMYRRATDAVNTLNRTSGDLWHRWSKRAVRVDGKELLGMLEQYTSPPERRPLFYIDGPREGVDGKEAT